MVSFSQACLSSHNTAMTVFTQATEADATYVNLSAYIFDDSMAFASYTAQLFIDSSITDEEYAQAFAYNTDGYALQFKFELGTESSGSDSAAAAYTVCASGSKTLDLEDSDEEDEAEEDADEEEVEEEEEEEVVYSNTTCVTGGINWDDNGDGTYTG